MSFNSKKYKARLDQIAKEVRADVESSILKSTEDKIDLSIILNEFSVKFGHLERRLLKNLTFEHPEDAEGWYLYSNYIHQIDKNNETAFEYAERSIEILKCNQKTMSSFSKHYILLASKLNEGELIQAELERISSLIDLSLEQKNYLVADLINTKHESFIPFDM